MVLAARPNTFGATTFIQTDAIASQQQALKQYVPKGDSESLALQTQKTLLNDFGSVEKQQAVVNTSFVNIQSAVSPAIATNLNQANQTAQIKALTTVENRDKLLQAIKYGVDHWRLQAHFTNIQIMGQTAIGQAGCLQGPSLKPWILQAPGIYNAVGYFRTLANAVADTVDNNFKQWQDFVTVPGLPWYPMFLAVGAPLAPPTPNIPMPLMVCVSQNFSKLASPSQLESGIRSNLPSEFKIAEMDMFIYMLSVSIMSYFVQWMGSQNVMMVMGMGPVPTFNPPYVPVGPVVNGYVIPSPGHLAA